MARVRDKEVKIDPSDPDSITFNVGTKAYGDVWATVSKEDWRLIQRYNWAATKRRNVFYVRNGRQDLLHRFIMRPPRGYAVDHIDGDPLNNRRSNLRICTVGENNSFAADARRGGPKPEFVAVPTKEHVVKKVLADGSVKEYRYKTRSKKGTVRKLAPQQ